MWECMYVCMCGGVVVVVVEVELEGGGGYQVLLKGWWWWYLVLWGGDIGCGGTTEQCMQTCQPTGLSQSPISQPTNQLRPVC